MHDHHKGHHAHHHAPVQEHGDADTLKKILAMLEHWIEHSDTHQESYSEWAVKAGEAGENEISREIHLAMSDSESAKKHLQRAKSILAAKLVLRK